VERIMNQLKTQKLADFGNFRSIIDEQSTMQPKGMGRHIEMSSELNLTSLIDCFTVLLIYLLIATTIGGEELDTPKELVLPRAAHSVPLVGGLVLGIQNGQYMINKEAVTLPQLNEKLTALRRNADSIIIQADRRADYSKLNPLVNASLQAGFTKIKFAVVKEDEGS
jgi:biopolymer transport protein ExbD